MKRIAIFLLALAAFTVQGWSQNVTQNVKVPAWEKFVQINKAGVNLRKAPNTQSARLMVHSREVECMITKTLSWTAGAGKTPYTLAENDIVPVIEEVGDWYRVFVPGPENSGGWHSANEIAFIRRDFCTTIEPYPLEYDSNSWVFKVGGNSGLYFCYEENEEDSEFTAKIGKPFGMGVVWLEYNGLFEYLKRFTGESPWGGLNMDMKSKITESRLNLFMQSHQCMPPTSISYMFDQNILTYEFNPEEYPFRMISQPETYTIQKFVVSANGQELQIRQKPNATAPKLVFVKGDTTPYFWGSMEWECRYRYANREPAMSATSQVFAVVGEEGGWYKVLGCYNYWYYGIHSAVGYVQKNDVTDAIVKPMTEAILRGDSYTANGSKKDGEGRIFNFSDIGNIVVTWGYPRVGSGAFQPAIIGQIYKGIAFMNEENLDYNFDAREHKAVIGNSSFLGSRLGKRTDSGYWEVDFTKLTNDDVRKLLRENPIGNYSVAYVNINDQYMHIFSLGYVNGRKIVFPAAH